jgi:mono/diheme cytochrome c family protein
VKAFVAGLIIGIIVLFAAVAYYFLSGRAPVAVKDRPMPFEKAFANGALHAHIDKEMPKSSPIRVDEAAFLAGAQVYQRNCALCHGLPTTDQSDIAKGMFPKPPELFKGKGVTDDPAGETYWKVKNGIRLTGMPEFANALSDTQMWQVSLLLANADKISDAVREQLKPPTLPGGSPTPPAAPAQRRPVTHTGAHLRKS